MQNCEYLIEFKQLPFVVKYLTSPHNEGLPDSLKMRIGIDKNTGIMVQMEDSEVKGWLTRAYLNETFISGKMEEKGNGRKYADDFIRYIVDMCGIMNGKEILEIGCGTGYLLWRLKSLGANVIGYEPGKKFENDSKYDIEIVGEFFEPDSTEKKFDIIIAYAVLEHISDVESFLTSIKKSLKYNGKLIIAVPNSEDSISLGDISMFMHQHYQYFTKKTLTHILSANGFIVGNCISAGYGNVLYITGVPFLTVNIERPYLRAEFTTSYNDFVTLYLTKFIKVKDIIKKFQQKAVGVYAPCRIINYLELLRNDIEIKNIRFFDDNPLMHSLYFPGFDIPIESREQLINNPVDALLIMTNSFGEKILSEVKKLLPNCKIYTWNEIFRQ